jgi:hypothetical protein
MSNTNQDLSQRIEQMVREHIATTHRAAQQAVERAFAPAARPAASAPRRVTSSLPGRKRRATAELVSLGDRFCRAVCANPGQTMSVLAAEVGASPRELHRAVALLKQGGRVRSVGSRNQTRYFPLTNGAAASV